MGSSWSRPVELVKAAAPPEVVSPANPAPPDAAGAPTSAAAQHRIFSNCLSCRVLSGSGLIGVGAYVYLVSRRPMKLGYAPGPGTIAQMAIGISIACWGIVILADPKGKAYRVV